VYGPLVTKVVSQTFEMSGCLWIEGKLPEQAMIAPSMQLAADEIHV